MRNISDKVMNTSKHTF